MKDHNCKAPHEPQHPRSQARLARTAGFSQGQNAARGGGERMKDHNCKTPHEPRHLRLPSAFGSKNRAAFLFALFALAFAASCQKGNPRLKTKTLRIDTASGGAVAIKAEIADTAQTREKGFMFRKKIPDGTGMLFVFEEDRVLSFWMKNTPTPLSIAYIDHAGIIKDIFDMKPFDLSDTTATGYVRYALEVPQGFFDRSGIRAGDRLVLDF